MKSGLFGLSGSIGLNDRGWYWLFAGFFVFIWGLAMALIYLEMRGINLTVGPQDRVERNQSSVLGCSVNYDPGYEWARLVTDIEHQFST